MRVNSTQSCLNPSFSQSWREMLARVIRDRRFGESCSAEQLCLRNSPIPQDRRSAKTAADRPGSPLLMKVDSSAFEALLRLTSSPVCDALNHREEDGRQKNPEEGYTQHA